MASMVILMITFGAFLPGCDTEDQGIDLPGETPTGLSRSFEFDSGEQLEQLINSLNYTPLIDGSYDMLGVVRVD